MTATPSPLAHDRAGPHGDLPVLLLHAGVADRRMWDPLWPDLTATRDVVRVDLRGYGGSTGRPVGALDPVADVLATLAALDVGRCHVVGASFGAGVGLELALARPALVASLLLLAPGGSLIPAMTPQLRAFVDAEDAAVERGDLDEATEANLRWWVDGPGQQPTRVDPALREAVRVMQRRALELTDGWDDVAEVEPDPPALARLGEVVAPTTVLLGGLDLDAIGEAADAVAAGVPDAARVDWPDVAHLPSVERPDETLALLRAWLADVEGRV